jgi:hypothetical protein
MSKTYETGSTSGSPYETFPISSTHEKHKFHTHGRRIYRSSGVILGIGLFLILSLFCTTLIPAHAKVNSSAIPSAAHQASLPSLWSGWNQVPGNGLTPDAPAATRFQGTLFLFVRGTDNRIYVNQLNGSTWSNWNQVPGNGLTPSGPAATQYGNTLYLFVRGTDNKIYVNTFDGSSWSGWSEVPGNGLTPDAPGATRFAKTLYLLVRGTDNRIYVNTFKAA